MRFLFAIVCFVLAALAIGLSVAERTVLAGPNHVSATTVSHTAAPVVVIDGTALNAYKYTQNVKLSGSTTQFAAYGRTPDVLAWVGDAEYTRVSFDAATGKLVSRLHAGSASQVPDPAGSDLWLQQFRGERAADFNIKIPSTMSVLAVSNGTDPAPSKVVLTWQVDNSTPWSAPLMLGGVGFLLLGLILLLWAFTHLRRTRGPRRTQPRMPKLPHQQHYKPTRKAITATKGRRSIRRMVAIVPVIALGSLVLAGCSSTPAPSVPTATATPKPTFASRMPPPAVTQTQLQHILDHITTTVTQADSTSNPTLIATRMEGPALEDRLANYIIRKTDTAAPASVAIPSTTVGGYTLPQATTTWPRVVFTVVQNPADQSAAPVALMLVQDDPRSNYKVNYAITLQPKIVLPEVAAATVGTSRLPNEIKLLQLQPSQLALAYGDILDKDAASPSYSQFQAEGDTFRTQVGVAAKKALAKKLPTTAKLSYVNANGDGQVIAMSTDNSGAIVAVQLDEIETVRPVKAGASVTALGVVKALSGKVTSSKGLVATWADQLLFYVPAASNSGKIVLLGYSQGLIAAQEYKK